MSYKIVTLSGDGIGPEIMEQGLKVLSIISEKCNFKYELISKDFGGVAIDKYGTPLPQDTLKATKEADAILLAAVGHPRFNNNVVRPEQGLLEIRKELGLFANVRPLKIYECLTHLSPLKEEIVKGVDIVIVRELTGGIYFGEHSLQKDKAKDVNEYTSQEIKRILTYAFELAQKRNKKLTSVDKQNVLSTSKLWRNIADEVSQNYPQVTLSHQLVDSMAMFLITKPKEFDVIVTENLFGDILTDEASALAGTLGVMASASHGNSGVSLYEPIHGSAPDIEGKGIANPISMILSVAMMLEQSFNNKEAAQNIENAVKNALKDNILTPDLGGTATTIEMSKAIINRLSLTTNA